MAAANMDGAQMNKKAAKQAAKAKKKQDKLKNQNNLYGTEDMEDEGGSSKGVIVAVTLVIVVIWIAILALLVKLDVGGFGSTVLQPILKDVPYVNKILPGTGTKDAADEVYPYATLDEAIERIKELEKEVSENIEVQKGDSEYVKQLESENTRLEQFEQEQAKFQEEKTKFYQEVVYADNAPDIKEYKTYYETIDPANAEVLYKQVVEQIEYDQEVLDYAASIANMKPKNAAKILEEMTDNLKLVAKILENMKTQARADILGAMDPKIASRIVTIMEP